MNQGFSNPQGVNVQSDISWLVNQPPPLNKALLLGGGYVAWGGLADWPWISDHDAADQNLSHFDWMGKAMYITNPLR